jgi:tRNA (guanine-N7-)-methyltransferase
VALLLISAITLLNRISLCMFARCDTATVRRWHVEKCNAHAAFEPLTDAEMAADPCVAIMREDTEEGKKVARSGGAKYFAVYRRKRDADVQFTILA